MPKKIYDIIPSQEESTIEEKMPPEKKDSRFFAKGLVFCLVLLVLLGTFGLFFFSKTEIEIWPKGKILDLEKGIAINTEIETSDFEKAVFPGKYFENEITLSREFSSTGKFLKQEKARGIITIYNEYSTSSRTFIPSRFVSADGKLFWSTKNVTIPGATYKGGKLIPGEKKVEVVAAEPGPDYNIGPTTFALPALAGSSLYTTIYAKSFSPMSGGFVGEVSQVSKEDLDRVKDILTEEAKTKSRKVLQETLPEGYVLIEETLFQELLETNASQEAGAEAETFNYQVKVKSRAMAVRKLDIENFAKEIINQSIKKEQKLLQESLEIHCFKESLKIKAKVYFDINKDDLKKALLGKSFQEAELFLKNLQEIEKVDFRSRPFLRRKISENPERLDINIIIEG